MEGSVCYIMAFQTLPDSSGHFPVCRQSFKTTPCDVREHPGRFLIAFISLGQSPPVILLSPVGHRVPSRPRSWFTVVSFKTKKPPNTRRWVAVVSINTPEALHQQAHRRHVNRRALRVAAVMAGL